MAGTMLGFGVKFEGPDAPMAGQNDRASYVVWPKSLAQHEAVLPLPAGTTYSSK
jgi:hypothetical protein